MQFIWNSQVQNLLFFAQHALTDNHNSTSSFPYLNEVAFCLEAPWIKFFKVISSCEDISGCLVRGAHRRIADFAVSHFITWRRQKFTFSWSVKVQKVLKHRVGSMRLWHSTINIGMFILISNRISRFGCEIQWPLRHPGHGLLHVNNCDRSNPGSRARASDPSGEPQAEGQSRTRKEEWWCVQRGCFLRSCPKPFPRELGAGLFSTGRRICCLNHF